MGIGVGNGGWGKGLGDIEANKQNVTLASCTQGEGERKGMGGVRERGTEKGRWDGEKGGRVGDRGLKWRGEGWWHSGRVS